MLMARLLGQFKVELNRVPVDPASRPVPFLLAYLKRKPATIPYPTSWLGPSGPTPAKQTPPAISVNPAGPSTKRSSPIKLPKMIRSVFLLFRTSR